MTSSGQDRETSRLTNVIRDLGSLVIEVDGRPRPVRGNLAATLLARLVVNAGQRVSVDALIDALWGDGGGSRAALEVHMVRLRQHLESDRAPGDAPAVLVHEVGGYRLALDKVEVDSVRFEELLVEAGKAVPEDPAHALALLERASALWRGRPFGIAADAPWAAGPVSRLETLHVQLIDSRMDALLAVGDTERALAELEELLADEPLREAPWRRAMVAAYRLGRADHALSLYTRARRVFLEALGTEPSEELATVQLQVLTHDPALGADVPSISTTRSIPGRVPRRRRRLIGREKEIVSLRHLTDKHRLVSVVGTGGSGKTQLASEIARQVRDRYPDGVWFVELVAAQTPGQVRERAMSALRLAPSTGYPDDDLAGRLRGHRMLLVLDNCEQVLSGVVDLVDSILDDTDDVTVLATSREPLGIDDEVIFRLSPLATSPAGLDGTAIASAPAVELFLERARAVNPDLEIGPREIGLAADICVGLDGVPLAIELAASRALSFSLSEIAEQVAVDAAAIGTTGRIEGGHHDTVQASIEWSHELLSPPEQLLHRRVALIPGPFTGDAAAALMGDVADPSETQTILARLVNRSLLTSVRPRRTRSRSQFLQLATVRSHARHALASRDDADAAMAALSDWVVALVHCDVHPGFRTEDLWFDALDGDDAAVHAVLQAALAGANGTRAVQVAARAGAYWYFRGAFSDARHWLGQAMQVQSDADPIDRAALSFTDAIGFVYQSRLEQASARIETGLRQLGELDAEAAGVMAAHQVSMVAGTVWLTGAPGLLNRLADVSRGLADKTTAPAARLQERLVSLMARDGQPRPVLDAAAGVYELAVQHDAVYGQWLAAKKASDAARWAGDRSVSARWARRALSAMVRFGPTGNSTLLEHRGNLAVVLGDPAAAVHLFGASAAQSVRESSGWPGQTETAPHLELVRSSLGGHTVDELWATGQRLGMDDLHEKAEAVVR